MSFFLCGDRRVTLLATRSLDSLQRSFCHANSDRFSPASVRTLWYLGDVMIARLANDILENQSVLLLNCFYCILQTAVIRATLSGHDGRLADGIWHLGRCRTSVSCAGDFWWSGTNALFARIFRRKSVAQVYCFVSEPANRVPWNDFVFLHIQQNGVLVTKLSAAKPSNQEK